MTGMGNSLITVLMPVFLFPGVGFVLSPTPGAYPGRKRTKC